MRVFDFTLLSGYEFSGVDVAQGFRARLFAKNNVNAKFIFTELPTIRDMELYGSQKIKRGQIMSAHLFMTGRLDMSLSVKKEALLENEKENYEYDNIDEDGKVIRLYNSGEKSVEILCDEDGFVINESLFKNGKKYLEKGSYFFYEQLLADNKENTNLSADLRNVAKLLKESGSYTGALDLNYREFARIYEFVNNVGDRHNHNCYLVMVTMNTLPEQLADIEEIEKALDCMEQSIRSKIRKVDVCTRYSSMQYLIILFEPQENQIPNVMERIFMHYYELCDRENFKPQYEYIKMTEVK